MKQTTKMSRAVNYLEKIVAVINQDKFDGELPVPVVTVQSKPGSWGHMSRAKIWKRGHDDAAYELNIAAELLAAPIEEILDTIIHELVHCYCTLHDIKETSRNGAYHNKRFKEQAERVGLRCHYTGEKSGWNTSATDELVQYALDHGWSEIMICRYHPGMSLADLFAGSDGSGSSVSAPFSQHTPSHIRKYQCPECGCSVRASKAVNIMCLDCGQTMVIS